MSDHILPVLYTLFLWWFSTGLIVWLDGLPRRTFRWSLTGATILAAIGLYGLAVERAGHQRLGRLHRLHLRPDHLGLERDQLPDGLHHRPAPGSGLRPAAPAGCACATPSRPSPTMNWR